MVKDHLVLCGSARPTSRKSEWRNAEQLRLAIGKGRKDIHLHFEHISRSTFSTLPDIALDLIELAAFVYTADQAITRGGLKEFDYGSHWRRNFRLEVPVRRPEIWGRQDVQDTLQELLGFLSEENFEFAFSTLKNQPPRDKYLFHPPAEGDSGFEEVMLFSGGLDSLGGAVQEVLMGQRKTVLVSHRPVNKMYTRQSRLVEELARLLADRRLRPLHVPVEVNKGKSLGKEFTQRTRSFLFAAIAAVIARMFGLSRFRFYENGIVSLNLPITPAVVGSRATRSTHPRALEGFGRLFSLLFDKPFAVENPFFWKTKAEILRLIKAAGYGKLCAITSSCTRTQAMTTMHTHCGSCSQCVDRRLNALAAELKSDEDPPEMYKADVLKDPHDGPAMTLIERYIGNAFKIRDIKNPHEMLARFGEASRAIKYLGLPTEDAATRLFELCGRHADTVFKTIQQIIRDEATDVVLRSYAPTSLIGILVKQGEGPNGSESSDRSEKPRSHVLDTDTFEVRWGSKVCFLGNTIEFHVLAKLLKRPGQFISTGTLMDEVWDGRRIEKNTVQRTISNLRSKLASAGISQINLDGKQRDHYRVIVNREPK